MPIINVPLSDLDLSPANHRKTGGGNVDDLIASIRAHGLLQNLTVVESIRGAKYQVIAGGRRLRALRALQEQDHIPADWPVPCNVVATNDADEASLTENVSREAMHPADEFDAFARLVDDGVSIGDIAARFGRSERYVQQRLRLAHVSPTILAEYRAGNATLEQMMALAICDDQARQLRVWKAARGEWQREPNRLRADLTEDDVAVDSALGQFVGIEAYEKAGGVVRRDLFGGDEDSFLADTEVVQQLALVKLERTADKIRKEGWAWVEARIEFGWQERQKFAEAPCTWKGSKRVYADAAKANAGAVIHIAHNGQAHVERGLIKPEDRKAAQKALNGKVTGGSKAPAARKAGDLSFASVQRLQAEATRIVALAISQNHEIALALLAAELADDVFYDGWNGPRTWIYISRNHSGRGPGTVRIATNATPAALQFAELENAWRERLPKKRGEARAWILAQDAETVRQLLAFLVARETEAIDIAPDGKQGVAELAAATGVDLAATWRPSADWLAMQPKNTLLALAKDAGADAVALAELAKQPKAKLAEQAMAHFKPGWLPRPLRAAKAAGKGKARHAS